MKTIKNTASALFQFFFPLLVDPGADTLRAYLPSIVSLVLLGMLIAGRPHPALLAISMALALADKALTAWVATRGVPKRPG